MTFIEAVKDLAQQYGLQVPEDDTSPQDRERAAQQREKQATLTDVLEKAGDVSVVLMDIPICQTPLRSQLSDIKASSRS